MISYGVKRAHRLGFQYQLSLKQNTHSMGKFSSFLIYSRKNIKHSENIFHILRAIQNILHGFQQLSSSTDPLIQ